MDMRGAKAMNKSLFHCDVDGFGERVKKWAAGTGKNISEACREQWRLYAGELINRTPPFSGKAITKMLIARGKAPLSDPGIEKASAKKVGEQAVMRDMRKLFLIVKNWWGAKVGKSWTYLFSSGSQHVGVPTSYFNPSPSRSWMQQIRGEHRDRRGRVNYKGQERSGADDRVTVLKWPVPEQQFEMLGEHLTHNVGRARAGWANAFVALGGKISGAGWVGRWLGKTGSCQADFSKPWNASVLMVNSSEWASGGDEDRIRAQAMAQRERAIEKHLEFVLKEKWG